MFLSSYRNPREGLGELEKAVETLAYGSHSISRYPKPPLVFLKLDRNTKNVFYFLINVAADFKTALQSVGPFLLRSRWAERSKSLKI